MAIAISRIGKGILDPIVEFLRPLPPLAYLPLIIIWFGIGETSKIAVITLAFNLAGDALRDVLDPRGDR